jgi:carotenoid 1,2-hydratase
MDASVFPINRQDTHQGTLFGGGQRAPGPRSAHGSDVGAIGGRSSQGAPRFDQEVKSGGYLWWYVDAMSDDGAFGLSLIAFVGSVFSPYYAKGIKKHKYPNPMNHCALNVALYTPKSKHWAMTERPQASVHRDETSFVIGPSCVHWDGQALHIDIDEWSVPIPARIRGRVSVHVEQLFNFSTPLDAAGLHHWGPIAPAARVEVDLMNPRQTWRGHAYLDSNEGLEPIANTFTEWDWSRALMQDGSCCVVYDCQFIEGQDRLLALRFHKNGSIETFEAPGRQTMNQTAWRIQRRLRSESSLGEIVQLEDTPFYQRAIVENQLMGERLRSFHETLNAQRFATNWVQSLLPWRMPRIPSARRTSPKHLMR